MGMHLSDWKENIVGKGEIARSEQFLLFMQCFQKLYAVDASKWESMEQWDNTHFPSQVNFYGYMKYWSPLSSFLNNRIVALQPATVHYNEINGPINYPIDPYLKKPHFNDSTYMYTWNWHDIVTVYEKY